MKDLPHQAEAVMRYTKSKFFALLWKCGAGKTHAGIRIAEEKGKPTIIIAPNSMYKDWKDAIEEQKSKESEVFIYSSAKRNTKKYQEKLRKFINAGN